MSSSGDGSEYLRRDEAAKFCKVSVGTIDNWRKRGWVKCCQIGRIPLYTREALREAIERFGGGGAMPSGTGGLLTSPGA